jgi:hypothetical protein
VQSRAVSHASNVRRQSECSAHRRRISAGAQKWAAENFVKPVNEKNFLDKRSWS